jgi:hypothetical protein
VDDVHDTPLNALDVAPEGLRVVITVQLPFQKFSASVTPPELLSACPTETHHGLGENTHEIASRLSLIR